MNSDFFTSSEFLVPLIGGLKGFAVCMFGLNVGVVLTWVERRMRGMIQDSIGPNRAAIPLPGVVAAGAATGPALLLAGLVGLLGYFSWGELAAYESWGSVLLHGGIFLTWMTLSLIARVVRKQGPANELEKMIGELGGPRPIFYVGLAAHLFFALLPEFLVGLGVFDAPQM